MTSTLLLALGLAAARPVPAGCTPPHATVLVVPFSDRTDGTWTLWTGTSVSRGFAAMLADTLAHGGQCHASCDGAGGDEAAAIAEARAAGASIVVTGRVTRFGYEDRTSPGRLVRWGVRDPSQRVAAVVSADLRALDVVTGTLLFETSVSRERVLSSSSMAGDHSFDSRSEFDDALVGRAARDVLGAMADALEQRIALQWSASVLEAPSPGTRVLDVGEAGGLEPGIRLVAWRPGIQTYGADALPTSPRESSVGEVVVTGFADRAHRRALVRIVAGDVAAGDTLRPCGVDGSDASASLAR